MDGPTALRSARPTRRSSGLSRTGSTSITSTADHTHEDHRSPRLLVAGTLLTALHVGVSFALGRWAAPMLPVGEDHTGKVVWEDWRASHCDPARNISPGWWYEREYASLTDFLGRVITAFADPDRLPTLRLQLMLGIAAMNDRRFVEQRVMMGTAGLEHIMWQTLVLEGGTSECQYRDQDAHEKQRAEGSNPLRPVLQPTRSRREGAATCRSSYPVVTARVPPIPRRADARGTQHHCTTAGSVGWALADVPRISARRAASRCRPRLPRCRHQSCRDTRPTAARRSPRRWSGSTGRWRRTHP